MDHLMRIGFALFVLGLSANFIKSWEFFFGGITILIVLFALYQKELQ